MRVLVAGDYCPRYRVKERIERGDYSSLISIKGILSRYDYSIVNLECPITKGEEKPIQKCGPNLSVSNKGLDAVKYAGFNCVTLANNHFRDYGTDAIRNTIEECEKRAIDYVGGGITLAEASSVLYKKIAGQVLAIINCCEHEFSIASKESAGSNPLNPIQQYYAIQEAKEKSNYVLVIVHGGNEHYQLPSLRMKEVYHFFIEAGADAVVNHHQHCFSGYELYKGKPIFYGLGNFLFDDDKKRNCNWNYGFLVGLDFYSDRVGYVLYPYEQCNNVGGICELSSEQHHEFHQKIALLNSIISDNQFLYKEFLSFCATRRNDLLISVMPYKSRLFKALAYRGFLPSFFGKRKAILLYNYINCESHLDTFKLFLEDWYEE